EGRRLKQIVSGSHQYKYTYNEKGMTVEKDVNGIKTTYQLQGSKVVCEIKNNETIYYHYDEKNRLVGFEYNNEQYFYVRDLMGIIRNILNKNGSIVVIYRYDAWDNHKVINPNGTENENLSFIGNINPFRYNTYYYDIETNWY